MDELKSLNHTKWDCKYHVVFIPEYRRKTLYGQLRQYLGVIFRKLAEQKQSRIEEGHLMPDHVHMMISIPPKHEPWRRTARRSGTVSATPPSAGSAPGARAAAPETDLRRRRSVRLPAGRRGDPQAGRRFRPDLQTASHKTVAEYLFAKPVEEHRVSRIERRKCTTAVYRWIADVPLRAPGDALTVAWFSVAVLNAAGKRTYLVTA
jgi:REP element-mobilizing transposase RayT